MIVPKNNLQQHNYQDILTSQRNPEHIQHQRLKIPQTILSRAFAFLSFGGSVLKAAGQTELGEHAESGAKIFSTTMSARAVISGQAQEDLQRDFLSADASERFKFWSAASSYMAPVSSALQMISSQYKDKTMEVAMVLGNVSGILKPLGELIRSERAGASAISSFDAYRKMSKKAPTREKVITQAGLVEASTAVGKIATTALGYPEISLGLAIISNSAGLVKAFAKQEGFTPYQNEWRKEFLKVKSELNTLIEQQFKESIKQIKERKDITINQKNESVSGLEISFWADRKAVIEAPDEEVLARALLYFEIESHSLYMKQFFKEWKSKEISILADRCSKLNSQKTQMVDEQVQGLMAQKENIKALDQQLDEARVEIKTRYKKGNPCREFMIEEIYATKAFLKEEQDKIDSILEEKSLNIDHSPPLPMFEAHELTEDLSLRYDVNDWIERAEALHSPEHKAYLDKKIVHALEEPSMVDILNI